MPLIEQISEIAPYAHPLLSYHLNISAMAIMDKKNYFINKYFYTL